MLIERFGSLKNVRICKIFTTIQRYQTRPLLSRNQELNFIFSRNYQKERSPIIINPSNVLFQVSKLTFPKNSLKLSNSIILSNHRNFHVTPPTRALPALPAFLTIFKSANAVLLTRGFSKLFLSFLPFALRKNPITGKRRRLLLFISTVFPLTGFGILFLAGLEQAPHTNRWRFRFMLLNEEKELCDSAFLSVYDTYKDKILGHNRIEVIFVNHVMNNLVKGLNDDLMTLKTYKQEDSYDGNIKEIVTNSEVEGPLAPFVVYVVDDDSVINAYSFGAARKIIIFTGMLKAINYDEEFLSVIISHEIAHILQRHSSETLGFNQVMFILTDTVRTLLWFPFLAALGPFINEFIDDITQKLIAAYALGRYNQKEEKEADFVGLQLMALSGYHPAKAVELWSHLAIHNDKIAKDDLPEFYLSHPNEYARSQYLAEVLPDACKIYEDVIKNEGKALLFSHRETTKKPNETTDQTGRWFIWKFF
ncbi:peptidase family M48-domain-containing protein [Gigaspora margarita]|uniref:Peptidase family M48-domain-containing protein n=1 Tax=Gigaspora margarita TaxID=4874 RepID=A0A8H3ZW41_GIGMA|nr:peptidase family M48-domain-containing protein [Gigaspora margarita]